MSKRLISPLSSPTSFCLILIFLYLNVFVETSPKEGPLINVLCCLLFFPSTPVQVCLFHSLTALLIHPSPLYCKRHVSLSLYTLFWWHDPILHSVAIVISLKSKCMIFLNKTQTFYPCTTYKDTGKCVFCLFVCFERWFVFYFVFGISLWSQNPLSPKFILNSCPLRSSHINYLKFSEGNKVSKKYFFLPCHPHLPHK